MASWLCSDEKEIERNIQRIKTERFHTFGSDEKEIESDLLQKTLYVPLPGSDEKEIERLAIVIPILNQFSMLR